MTTPAPLFCLSCGPRTELERDPVSLALACPDCGEVTELPLPPLFVITGASGAGKTAVMAPLRRLLPECDVFEGDLLGQVAALGWDTWRDTWLRIAYAVALNGRSAVLCTSLIPAHLETLPARGLLGDIRFGNLDCRPGILADRLRARPSWRHSSTEEAVAEHQEFAAWLRVNIEPSWDTGGCTPDEAAALVAAWIRPQLR